MAEPVDPSKRTGGVSGVKVALSTASVYPESTATAFEIAARLGYDGVEVMVWTDPVSQDVDALQRLSDYHRMPILAVHAPCLLITQRVWSTDPWVKLQRARKAALRLGASTVVVHPPFRWQRTYARDFVRGIWRMADETEVRFAVENMYPWRYRDREMLAYAPDWDVTKEDYRHFTVDLSHAATSRTEALEMVGRMGDRLAHVHLADGSGSAKDEHLVPGRGTQPCGPLLESLAATDYRGHVVIEVNTRRAMSAAEREADLAEALAFTRRHLAVPSPSRPSSVRA
ncbi:sugar phosphate isomerase/epimerase family protein [Streptomyces sp. NBC_01198]|uniref:sugar phosphate isomerase/epimerase family protein n=1 Tax=Streptomyces sp. NBC_01198 TaxID=2903769 RepID=UPI002E0D3421|nr:sugar phosphate isomerase/epimerase [Streptomyces sp. NBC_01198]